MELIAQIALGVIIGGLAIALLVIILRTVYRNGPRGRRLSKVHRATEWLKPSFARSSATMSASVRDQMPKISCVSCQLGSPTITRFTRTRLSDIVHPVSSSQLTQDPDRVRSFGGYNKLYGDARRNFRRETYLCSCDERCR